MLVQTLMDNALPYIDEIGGTYGTDHLPLVNKIIADCMRQEIGISPSYYRVDMSTYTADYTPTDDDYVPVRLPFLTEDQIINVQMDGYPDMKMYTETNGAYFYLLVPATYSGIVEVKWMAAIQALTSMSDTVPISDSACMSVAAIGLASLLALSEAEDKVSFLESKYQEAVREWKKRHVNKPRRVRAHYNLED